MSDVAQCQWELLSGGLFVFYGSQGHFSDDVYQRWYRDVTESGALLYLRGTARGFRISGAQRNHGRSFFLNNRIPFVTITDDPIVRGFTTAARWFGVDVSVYTWVNLPQATARLGLDDVEGHRAQTALLRLRAAVDCRLHAANSSAR
jgi:hypothetical protein